MKRLKVNIRAQETDIHNKYMPLSLLFFHPVNFCIKKFCEKILWNFFSHKFNWMQITLHKVFFFTYKYITIRSGSIDSKVKVFMEKIFILWHEITYSFCLDEFCITMGKKQIIAELTMIMGRHLHTKTNLILSFQ